MDFIHFRSLGADFYAINFNIPTTVEILISPPISDIKDFSVYIQNPVGWYPCENRFSQIYQILAVSSKGTFV